MIQTLNKRLGEAQGKSTRDGKDYYLLLPLLRIKPSHLAYDQSHYDKDIPLKWYSVKKDQCKPNE
jgi:hypothetical protein